MTDTIHQWVCPDDFLLSSDQMRQRPPRFTPFQRPVIATLGMTLIASGIVTIFAVKLFFHASQESFIGLVLAPFGLVVGTLLILLAVRMGKEA